MLRQIEWGVQNGPITKNQVLLVTTLFFRKFCFSLRTSYKPSKPSKCSYLSFSKALEFNLGCFFPVSILNSDANWICTIPFKVLNISLTCTYSSKNNSGVSRFSYVVKKNISLICAFFYFLNWKYFLGIWKNNSSLLKPILKYLVYYQVFWVKVRRPQDQCRSMWKLVFCYFVSNILQRLKNFIRNLII